jgi:hypothetical protein
MTAAASAVMEGDDRSTAPATPMVTEDSNWERTKEMEGIVYTSLILKKVQKI